MASSLSTLHLSSPGPSLRRLATHIYSHFAYQHPSNSVLWHSQGADGGSLWSSQRVPPSLPQNRSISTFQHSRVPASAPKRVLVFRIGQLGDTIVALPSMWAVREHFRDAHLTLLCDRHPDENYVFGPDLLKDTGLFDSFEFYPVHSGQMNRFRQASGVIKLLATLRRNSYDTLVYLSPSARTQAQVARDLRFFRAGGVRNFIGTEGFSSPPIKIPGQPMQQVPHEAEMLLARLAASDISIPPQGRGCMNLRLGVAESAELDTWLRTLSSDSRRAWVGFGPGSKMPAKRWPFERFAEVGRQLIVQRNIWPVVFGGPEDCADGESLLQQWGCGYNAAGRLSLRGAAVALQRCLLYVGNDTGTMHLAAAVGTRCVAIFSARDWPGRWDPYGERHVVLRSQVACEGCGLVSCVKRGNLCLGQISIAELICACQTQLRELQLETN